MTTQRPRPYRRGFAKIPVNWTPFKEAPWGNRVIIEVGCGTGDWICQEAAQHPTIYYIGIEQTELRSEKFLQKVGAAKCPNLLGIRADAVLLLDSMCPDNSVDAFYFHYPNPYHKSRQANRRLIAGTSMWVFDRCLKPGGTLYLSTNIESYAAEAAHSLEKAWGYTLKKNGTIAKAIAPRTAFERKYLARGEALFEVLAQKP